MRGGPGRTRSVLPRRQAPAWRRWYRAALLAAYAVVLFGSPAGWAARLRHHLATEHHAESVDDGRGHIGVPAPPERHAAHCDHPSDGAEAERAAGCPAAGHTHTEPEPGSAAPDVSYAHTGPEPRSVAPNVPHAHQGEVHTHEEGGDGTLAARGGATSEFYLAPEPLVLEHTPAPVSYLPPPGTRVEWRGAVFTPPPRDLI